jgi:hypothetical protein
VGTPIEIGEIGEIGSIYQSDRRALLRNSACASY